MYRVILVVAIVITSFVLNPLSSHAQEVAPFATESVPSATEMQDRLTRLEAAKQLYRVSLTNEQRERIVFRCAAAQTQLVLYAQRVEAIEQQRRALYGSVISELQEVQSRALLRGIDLADLDLLVANVQLQSQFFEADIANFRQAITDTALIACAEQPELFVAGLQAARATRVQILNDSQRLRGLLKNEAQSALTAVRNRLPQGVVL